MIKKKNEFFDLYYCLVVSFKIFRQSYSSKYLQE